MLRSATGVLVVILALDGETDGAGHEEMRTERCDPGNDRSFVSQISTQQGNQKGVHARKGCKQHETLFGMMSIRMATRWQIITGVILRFSIVKPPCVLGIVLHSHCRVYAIIMHYISCKVNRSVEKICVLYYISVQMYFR